MTEVVEKRVREIAAVWEQRAETRKKNEMREKGSKKLVSNIKKTTTFLRKVKSFNSAQKDSMAKDIETLNLSKYVSEVVVGLVDQRLTKNVDLHAAVHIASLMHRYYKAFSDEISEQLIRQLESTSMVKAAAHKNDKSIALRLRSALRFFIELFLVGVLQDIDPVMTCFRDLIKTLHVDMESQLYALVIINTTLKNYTEELLGVTSRDGEPVQACLSTPNPLANLVSEEMKSALFKDFLNALRHCSVELRQQYDEVQNQLKSNQHIEFYKGTIPEAAASKLEQLQSDFDLLKNRLFTLASLLDEDEPDFLPEAPCDEEEQIREEPQEELNLFEDMETKYFYESIPELQLQLPPILFQEKGGDEKREARKTVTDAMKSESEVESAKNTETDAFSVYLESITDMTSKESVDTLAERYCYLQNRGTKARLVAHLHRIHPSRLDLLPYLGRLATTLDRCFPGIVEDLVVKLKGQFFGLNINKGQHNLLNKIRNVSFIAELVKFKAVHYSLAFDLWHFCHKEFIGHNIHVVCAMLESCGRWMYKNPETHDRCEALLESLGKLKVAKPREQHICNLIDSAIYQCNPPDRTKVSYEKRPLVLEYVRMLLYEELLHHDVDSIVPRLLRLNWGADCRRFMKRALLEVYHVNSCALPKLARLAVQLDQYHRILCELIDDLLEEIRFGMANTIDDDFQKRLAHMRFLGLLCYEGAFDESVLIEQLYLLITLPLPSSEAKKRARSSRYACFRIRLVCTLLEYGGSILRSYNGGDPLALFLLYFHQYERSNQPLPVDLDFYISETLETVDPQWVRPSSLEECRADIKSLQEKQALHQPSRSQKVAKQSDANVRQSQATPKETSALVEYDWSARGLRDRRGGRRSKEDEQFMAMYESMMESDVDVRKTEPKAIRNLMDADTLLMNAKVKAQKHQRGKAPPSFKLMTRKNKGVVSKSVSIPDSAGLTERSIGARKDREAENKLLKKIVSASLSREQDGD